MRTLSINNDLIFIQNYLTEHKTQTSKFSSHYFILHYFSRRNFRNLFLPKKKIVKLPK